MSSDPSDPLPPPFCLAQMTLNMEEEEDEDGNNRRADTKEGARSVRGDEARRLKAPYL